MTNIHALMIAAGQSQRMGLPKQLLPWGKKTLIEHQIKTLQKAHLSVSVVLGAQHEQINKTIAYLKVSTVYHPDWQLGMGSSIACGVKAIDNLNANYDGILIVLVDQPLVTTEHIDRMVQTFDPGRKQIIVSQTSSGISGPPVLFDAHYFKELKTLDGDDGAKPIVRNQKEYTMQVTADCNLEDMDTVEDYRRLLALSNLQS